MLLLARLARSSRCLSASRCSAGQGGAIEYPEYFASSSCQQFLRGLLKSFASSPATVLNLAPTVSRAVSFSPSLMKATDVSDLPIVLGSAEAILAFFGCRAVLRLTAYGFKWQHHSREVATLIHLCIYYIRNQALQTEASSSLTALRGNATIAQSLPITRQQLASATTVSIVTSLI